MTSAFGGLRIRVSWLSVTSPEYSKHLGLLGGIFAYAVDCGMIEMSPVVAVKRFADKKGNRYLIQEELVALGEALRQAEFENRNPSALAI